MSSGGQTSLRAYVAGVVGYGKFFAGVDLLDTIIVLSMFRFMKPNNAIYLLCVLTCIRSFNIVWYYIAADYALDTYSDTTLQAIAVGLEFGYIVYDHVSMLSIVHRLMALYSDKMQKYAILALAGLIVSIGIALRIIRCSVRFSSPFFVVTAYQMDLGISINALLGELIMLLFVLYKCLAYRKRTKGANALFDLLIAEGVFRMYLMIPLGIAEATFYALQGQTTLGYKVSQGLIWFCFTGLMARHMSGTITATAILLTRHSLDLSIKSQAEKSKGEMSIGPIPVQQSQPLKSIKENHED